MFSELVEAFYPAPRAPGTLWLLSQSACAITVLYPPISPRWVRFGITSQVPTYIALIFAWRVHAPFVWRVSGLAILLAVLPRAGSAVVVIRPGVFRVSGCSGGVHMCRGRFVRSSMPQVSLEVGQVLKVCAGHFFSEIWSGQFQCWRRPSRSGGRAANRS